MEATRVMTMVHDEESLSVRLLRGRRGLEALRPAWEELAEHLTSAAFFHQYAWYENYVCHLEHDPRCLFFALVNRGTRVLAIVPLRYRKPERLGGLRVFQLPSHDHICAADALVRRGEDYGVIMNLVIRQLRRSAVPAWDMLLFPEVPAGSCADLGLRRLPRLFVVCESARDSDYIPNSGGYEATVQRLSGSFKRDLRRKLKHARNSGTLTYRSIESPEKLDEAFEKFLEIEGSGWKGRHGIGTAINCRPELEAFYRGLLHARTASSHCVINLLYLNDACIGAEFCLYCAGALNLLKIGYQESHARVSPGSLLFDFVLRDWCERPGLREISFVGDASWQKTWRPDRRPVYRYRVYNRTARALPARAWRAVRPLLVDTWIAMRRFRENFPRMRRRRRAGKHVGA